MQQIKAILTSKAIPQATPAKKLRPDYERAVVFAKRYGLTPIFVLKLFKKFGQSRVLNLDSWLRDLNMFDSRKGYYGIITWKLKQEQEAIHSIKT